MRTRFLYIALLPILGACGTGTGSHEAKDTVSLGPVPADTMMAPPQPHTTPSKSVLPPESGLRLRGLGAGDTLRSPARVEGEARGSWYFEGQFVLKLYDSLQRLLALIPARAGKDWLTEDLVPFRGELSWKGYTGRGTLVLEADNPSGDEERAKRVSVPLFLSGEAAKR